MSQHTLDFLYGLLVGNIFLPALLYRLRAGGRWDGWIDGRRATPSVGQFVLVYDAEHRGMAQYKFAGAEGGGTTSEVYWRPMPRPPLILRRPP